jgi:hypothetical protein
MKSLTATVLTLLLIITGTAAFSQKAAASKPALFTAFPNVINCNAAELSRVFSAAANQTVNLSLAGNFSFTGTVTSNVVKYSNLQSVVIKSPVFSNAIFHLSKRTNPDNSITYVGRIINQDYNDGYELKQDVSGNYQLRKIETDRVIQNCSRQ